MEANRQRVDEFRQEITDLNIRTPDDKNERVWLYAGFGCIIASLLVIGGTWWQVSGEVQLNVQLPYAISGGLIAILLAIVGSALFIRFSMTRYLRFWLVRYIYEDRSQADREVEALHRIEELLRTAVRPRQPQ